MKRTGEVVLGILGILFFVGLSALGFFLAALMKSDTVKDEIQKEVMENEQGLTIADIDSFINLIGGAGWYFVVISLIAVALGILALLLLRGEKNPKAAGIILIVTGVVGTLITVGFGIISGLFYLIAGIMCLTRKPQTPMDDEEWVEA